VKSINTVKAHDSNSI